MTGAPVLLLCLGLGLTACSPPEPAPVTQIVLTTPAARPDIAVPPPLGEKAALAVKTFRRLESKVPAAVASPSATAAEVRDIYSAVRRLHAATQTIVSHGRRATPEDLQRARDAVEALSRALDAAKGATAP